jgi:TonB family protein
MQSPVEPAKRRTRAVVLSSSFHAAILASLAVAGAVLNSKAKSTETVHPRFIATIQVAGGTHAPKIKFRPMSTAAHTRKPAPDKDATTKTILPIPPTQPLQKSGGGSPSTPHTGNGSGKAMARNGSDNDDIHPAFPVFSPHPPVTDRALLPKSEEKIVVDVSVDELGAVVSENLVKGMGNQLDQIVLDIVKTWRFQPATVNGKPVPTEAELIFPFNPSYPITDS